MRALWLLCVCGWFVASKAQAHLSAESRSTPDAALGAMPASAQYVGDNDSLPEAFDTNAQLPFDRWVTSSFAMAVRQPVWRSETRQLVLEGGALQHMYTPREVTIASVDALHGDRPFGGTLAARARLIARQVGDVGFALRRSRLGFAQATLGVDFASVGAWSFSGVVQDNWHALTMRAFGQSPYVAKGWRDVVIDGRVAANINGSLEATVLHATLPHVAVGGTPIGTSLTSGCAFDVGGIGVAGDAFAAWRAGLLRPPMAPPGLTGYVVVQGLVRAVGYNASIDDPVGGVSAQHAALVTEFAWGFAASLGGINTSLVQIARSNEVASLPAHLRTGQLLWRMSLGVDL